MNPSTQFSPLLRFLIAGACLVIIISGLKAAASLLNLVFLALLLAQSISPLLNWLMNKRLPPRRAVLVTLLVVVLGGVGVLSLLATSIAQLIEKLPIYQSELTKLQEAVITFLSARGLNLSHLLSLESLNAERVVGFAGTVLGGLAQALGNAFLVIFIVAVLLFELAGIQYKLTRGEDENSMVGKFDQLSGDTRKYVAIMGWTGLLQAIANVTVLLILRVDFAITWGVLFFFLNFIPAIGFFFALIPPALVALLDHGWPRALMVVIAYWGINFVGDNIIRPRFMQKGLDISILVVILSLIFWGWILGGIGAILAVPLTLTIKRFVQQYLQGTRPLAVASGGVGPASAHGEASKGE
jgi:AI-2 transport protein TqsA